MLAVSLYVYGLTTFALQSALCVNYRAKLPAVKFDTSALTFLVLVLKPADEEAFAPNNPRGHTGLMGQATFRPGVVSGEGHLREVAAYLLDHGGFAVILCCWFVFVYFFAL